MIKGFHCQFEETNQLSYANKKFIQYKSPHNLAHGLVVADRQIKIQIEQHKAKKQISNFEE